LVESGVSKLDPKSAVKENFSVLKATRSNLNLQYSWDGRDHYAYDIKVDNSLKKATLTLSALIDPDISVNQKGVYDCDTYTFNK
jgi:hypothetical protein